MHAFVALEGLLITVLPSARKQHNSGYKHKAHVRSYYQQFEEQQTQSLIDQRIKEHLGQAAAFQQVGGAYNHLMGQRPNLPPVLPPPRFPIPGGQPLMPGFRPLMPRPLPIPGAPGECFVFPSAPFAIYTKLSLPLIQAFYCSCLPRFRCGQIFVHCFFFL
ncbi:unnamed protein product [Lathyrus sativus]|nr:unnamed protein product [Lathyrus sativus]